MRNLKAMNEFERHEYWQELTEQQQRAIWEDQQEFIGAFRELVKKEDQVFDIENFNVFITSKVNKFTIADITTALNVAEEFDTYEVNVSYYKGGPAIKIGFKYVDGMELI